ncbi:MAG: InlB B-repeat-containing protein, partial [Klebsiella quasipneumoniae]|nr:InlB B-repeat-containing protein [Klebsiella quasipneumoniae]
VRIIASYSAGQITGNGAAGGLLGYTTGAYIANSYSYGEPSGSGALGGLAGISSAQIINSYTTYSAIAGLGGSPKIYNSYCLSEEADEQADTRTSAEMKTQAFAEVLRFAFTYRDAAYPALRWEEEPDSDYVILNYAESTTYAIGGGVGLVAYEEADTQVKVSKAEGLPAEDPAPVNDNFRFDRWYLDAKYEQVCQSIEMLEDGATVFAKWEINLAPVTITIDYGCAYQEGSTATTEERSIAYGSLLAEPSIERTGYELMGWYEVLNPGTETETFADSKFDFSVQLSADLMIRAVWQKTAVPDYTWYTTAQDSNEFHINEAAELLALARLVSGTNVPAEVAAEAVSFAGAEIYLDADIPLTDLITDDAAQYYWTLPIGTTKNTAFQGNFHGQGNTVSGLCIVTAETNQALFGYTTGAEITNLGIEGTVEADNYAALLVAYAEGGLISGAEADGSVSAVSSVASACSGGIIAYMKGGEVTGCTNRADVTAYSESTSSSSTNIVGGVIGSASVVTVNGCINEGTIRGAGTVGGVVGAGPVNIAISYCENHGTVEGGWRYGPGSVITSYVGGVAGNAYGVTYSVNTGDVTAYMLDSSSLTYAGGLTGWAFAGLYIYNYNEGDVLLESTLVSVTENTAGAVGGLIGRDAANAKVVNCYSQGTVSSVLAEGSVGTPATMAGGLTGYNYGSTAYYVHCYSSGSLLPLLGQVTGENIVEGSYYLAAATGTDGARSDADMRTEAFAKDLGFAYLYRSGDYPALFWTQEPVGDYIILNYSESKFYAYGSASGLVTKEEPDTRVKVSLPESGKLDEPETETTNTNFAFAGWFYQNGTEVNFATDVFTPGTEIYAEWVPSGVTVYFQSDVGSDPVEVSVPYGYTAEPYPMDKEGYSLLGWRKISSLTETDPTGEYFDFENTIIMEDTYLRADWQAEPEPADYSWYSPSAAEYRISDAGDLIGLAKLVGGFQGNAQDFAGRTIVLD